MEFEAVFRVQSLRYLRGSKYLGFGFREQGL